MFQLYQNNNPLKENLNLSINLYQNLVFLKDPIFGSFINEKFINKTQICLVWNSTMVFDE